MALWVLVMILLTLESCGELPVRIDEIEMVSGGEVFEISSRKSPISTAFWTPGC